ncbi:hypothetical protein ACF1BQ_011405 [Bradyrhizobium sp. RDT10]
MSGSAGDNSVLRLTTSSRNAREASNETKTSHRAPSLIEAGFYYEKGNSPSWLRRVIDFRGHEGRVRYVDFTGVGQCDISSLSRWAQRRLTREEGMTEFPDEIRKLEKRVLRCIGDLARAGRANDY